MRGHAVIGSDIDRAILAKLVGFQAVLNLGACGSFEVIFQAPGDLMAAYKEGAGLYPEADAGLEKIPGILAAGFEAVLRWRSDWIEHAEVALRDRPPVVHPGLLVTRVPERGIVIRPIEQCLLVRVCQCFMPFYG